MSHQWNDDERDTRISFSHTSRNSVQESSSAINAVKDYFQSQKESLYSWSVADYNDEVKRRMRMKVSLQTDDVDNDYYPISNAEEKQEVGELNNEIMDNEIYKKSWYS